MTPPDTSSSTSPTATAISISAIDSLDQSSNDDSVPPFSLKADRYDQSTYYGRFRKMLDVVDPRTLLCSQQELDDAVQLLKDFEDRTESGKLDSGNISTYHNGFDNEKLWQAKKIKDAIIHPDTGEIIPRPFRMSGYVVSSIHFSHTFF